MVTETQDPRTTSLMEVMNLLVRCHEEGKDEVSTEDLREQLPSVPTEVIRAHLATLAGKAWIAETNRVNFKPPRIWYRATSDGKAVLQLALQVNPAA